MKVSHRFWLQKVFRADSNSILLLCIHFEGSAIHVGLARLFRWELLFTNFKDLILLHGPVFSLQCRTRIYFSLELHYVGHRFLQMRGQVVCRTILEIPLILRVLFTGSMIP